MNPGILAALNSVATAAIANKDLNTLSTLQTAACFIQRLGTAYDGTAYNASATAYLNPNFSPYNGQIFDAQALVAKVNGLQPWQLGN